MIYVTQPGGGFRYQKVSWGCKQYGLALSTRKIDDDQNTLAYRFKLSNIGLARSASRTGLLQGGSNRTGTDLYVNKPHCAAAVRP